MHLGLIVYEGLDRISGGNLFDRRLVEHLRQSGDTVDVIPLPQHTCIRSVADNFSSGLRERLLGARFDVLLQDELTHPSLFLLNRELRRRAAYPVISIVHHLRSSETSPSILTLPARGMEKRYVRSADGFIFASRHTQRCVHALLPGPLPGIVAYPGRDRLAPAVTVQSVRGRVSRLEAFRVLFVGNVIPRKGVHVLLAALARLSDVPWTLDIAGNTACDRRYTAVLRRIVRKARLDGKVRFLGPVTDAALGELFAGSHVCAAPSRHEGFGIACLEALGFGLPVIASRSGGAAEIITHGREGFLVAPGDVRMLARCLRDLADDRRLLLDMSLRARDRHAAFPTWHASGTLVRGFLASFVSRRRFLAARHRYGIGETPRKTPVSVH